MDINGLAELMKQNREEMLRQFEDMKMQFCQTKESWDKRLIIIEKKVNEHSTTLTKIKSIGTFIVTMWIGVIILITKFFGGK